MVGERVGPGQTLDLRLALSVSGGGAYRITGGEIRDC